MSESSEAERDYQRECRKIDDAYDNLMALVFGSEENFAKWLEPEEDA